MTILVCGGRDYKNKEKVFKVLDAIIGTDYAHVITGGANGADKYAIEWAEGQGIDRTICDADWTTHGKAAGPIRNSEMLRDYPVDLVLAFKGGTGTKDMVDKAMKKGIVVLEVKE
jgi:hypothetical protein